MIASPASFLHGEHAPRRPVLASGSPVHAPQARLHARRRLAGLFAVVLLTGLGLAGCERGFPTPPSEPTISEDQFVTAMVAILSEAPAHQDSRLPEAERDRILRDMGLVPADLVTFAEVHGIDVAYMLSVWTRVDAEFLQAMNEAAQEPGAGEGPGGGEGPGSGDSPGPGGPGGPGAASPSVPGTLEGPGAGAPGMPGTLDGPGR